MAAQFACCRISRHVALCAGLAVRRRARCREHGRRLDAADPCAPTGRAIGADDLWVKDEGLNPTGSFKARGMACAISHVFGAGDRKTRDSIGGKCRAERWPHMPRRPVSKRTSSCPRDVPQSNYIECKAFGAHVTLVDGLISDCGRMVARAQGARRLVRRIDVERAVSHRRQEDDGLRSGRAVRLGAARCDLLSGGGGVGLIGMWKAFEEMEELGWIGGEAAEDDRGAGGRLPAGGEGIRGGSRPCRYVSERLDGARAGLRVPKPLGDRLMLEAIQESGGCAIAVSDREMLDAGADLASR